MTETKPKKKKFRYTRELIRIALDEGMKQTEIAQLCRVQQSKVSAWSRGESRALEHEVAELKKRFGHRLNRTTSRVYLAEKEEVSSARWEDTERAKRLLALREQQREVTERRGRLPSRGPRVLTLDEEAQSPQTPPEPVKIREERSALEAKQAAIEAERRELQALILKGDPNELSFEALMRVDQDDFEATRRPTQVTQVEGPIVLRYTFVRPEYALRGKHYELIHLPIARWLIHRQPDGKFVLVTQARRTLAGADRWRWWNALRIADEKGSGAHGGFSHGEHGFLKWKEEIFVECADDAARWLSIIHGPMDATALQEHCDKYFADPRTLHGPHDDATLPFLLLKMLVEQGAEVPGVARIIASD
jgi:transcriptional regulator with XRE-family HTH domain